MTKIFNITDNVAMACEASKSVLNSMPRDTMPRVMLELNSGEVLTLPRVVMEKFAELIVNECMALHDETIADYRKRRKVADDLVYKDVYAEGEAACVRTRAKIKKHFGVEE